MESELPAQKRSLSEACSRPFFGIAPMSLCAVQYPTFIKASDDLFRRMSVKTSFRALPLCAMQRSLLLSAYGDLVLYRADYFAVYSHSGRDIPYAIFGKRPKKGLYTRDYSYSDYFLGLPTLSCYWSFHSGNLNYTFLYQPGAKWRIWQTGNTPQTIQLYPDIPVDQVPCLPSVICLCQSLCQ